LKVKFEVNLDVRTLDAAGYRAFQDDLRKRLADKYIGPAGNNVAVLPHDNEGAPQWFDLRLTGAGGAQTTVRFRVGNLDVVGYQMGTTWYEFGKKGDKQWIPNSQFLGFRGDYGALANATGKAVTEINLNRFSFEAAVKTLATSTKGNERAAALIVVAQLVSEACRFLILSNALSTRINFPAPIYLNQWVLDDLEREWGTYSEILMCYNNFPDTYNFPKPIINQNVIATADELRKKLGILLNVEVNYKVCKITAHDVIAFHAQVQNPVELAVR